MSFKRKTKFTTGTPRYTCTNIDNNILYFGGNCVLNNCSHNNLFELNTLTLNWSEIICTTPDNIQLKNIGCRMKSFNMNGEYSLFLSGGIGQQPLTTQTDAQYIPLPNNPNHSYTNKIHFMNLFTSPGIT